MTRLPKLNNGSHRKEAASKSVSHSTCGCRRFLWAGDIKKGFSKRTRGQMRGEAGSVPTWAKAGWATGLRAAGSSTATCSSWRRKGKGGADQVASWSASPALPLFPFTCSSSPGKLWIVLGVGQMSHLLGIFHRCMLHAPLINIVIVCVARSLFV